MNTLFADTVYWIALLNTRDELHSTAKSVTQKYLQNKIITTDAVLIEILNQFSSYGEYWRNVAITAVQKILNERSIEVIPQTRELFLEGISFYTTRLDKGYSLVDCISMVVMNDRKIDIALTSDRYFQQEGFTILLR